MGFRDGSWVVEHADGRVSRGDDGRRVVTWKAGVWAPLPEPESHTQLRLDAPDRHTVTDASPSEPMEVTVTNTGDQPALFVRVSAKAPAHLEVRTGEVTRIRLACRANGTRR